MVIQDEADKTAYEILSKYHLIAVVGCSRNEGKPSHDVPEYMQSAGYKIIPVNPSADIILGEKAYKSLLDIKFPIDVVDVFRPSPETPEIARQAVQIKAKALWLQEGIFNDEAKKIAEDNGLLFIMNRCMMKEHYKLF
ncbi:MAG: CoA-binding protein [Candidatus Micrarchaeum sp. ARMAN-1]|jgi:predicted CoA-binding protein|nr:MAG: CoA-binding protein [Candidatus Micrarchaeum sp. ARMAN-1]